MQSGAEVGEEEIRRRGQVERGRRQVGRQLRCLFYTHSHPLPLYNTKAISASATTQCCSSPPSPWLPCSFLRWSWQDHIHSPLYFGETERLAAGKLRDSNPLLQSRARRAFMEEELASERQCQGRGRLQGILPPFFSVLPPVRPPSLPPFPLSYPRSFSSFSSSSFLSSDGLISPERLWYYFSA